MDKDIDDEPNWARRGFLAATAVTLTVGGVISARVMAQPTSPLPGAGTAARAEVDRLTVAFEEKLQFAGANQDPAIPKPELERADYSYVLGTTERVVASPADIWGTAVAEFAAHYSPYFDVAETPEVVSRSLVSGVRYSVSSPPTLLGFAMSQSASDGIAQLRVRSIEDNLDGALTALQQAALFRADRDDKAARAASLALEVADFLEADRLWRDGARAGGQTAAFKETVLTWMAQSAAVKQVAMRSGNAQQVQHAFPGAVSEIAVLHGRAAALPFQSITQGDGYTIFLNGVRATGEPQIQVGTAARQIAHDIYAKQSNLANMPASLEAYELDFAVQEAKQRLAASDARATWSGTEAILGQRRHEASVCSTQLKMSAAATPGGSLNYAEQEQRLRTMFHAALAAFSS